MDGCPGAPAHARGIEGPQLERARDRLENDTQGRAPLPRGSATWPSAGARIPPRQGLPQRRQTLAAQLQCHPPRRGGIKRSDLRTRQQAWRRHLSPRSSFPRCDRSIECGRPHISPIKIGTNGAGAGRPRPILHPMYSRSAAFNSATARHSKLLLRTHGTTLGTSSRRPRDWITAR